MIATRKLASLVLLVLVVIANRGLAQDGAGKISKYPQHILIIRHAEKTSVVNDIHLSKKGIERAAELHRLFESTKDRPDPFPAPDFVFAARNSSDSKRPVETVTPLTQKLKLPLDVNFRSKLKDSTDPAQTMIGLRDEILGKNKYHGKTILIAWRHSTIPELALTLGVKDAPKKWDDATFDRVWQLTFDDRGKITFRDRPQRLMPGDSVK